MKKNILMTVAVSAMIFFAGISKVHAFGTNSATPGCDQWTAVSGAWTFTYADPIDTGTYANQSIAGAQQIVFTDYCDYADSSNRCDSIDFVSASWNCMAKGYRVSDNKPIVVGTIIYAPSWYGYYEGSSTELDLINTIKANTAVPDYFAVPASPYTSIIFPQDGDTGPYGPSTIDNIFGGVSAVQDTDCIDADKDGYGANCFPGPDCDDADSDIHPGATEICNGLDDDCDNAIDEGFTYLDPEAGVLSIGETCSAGIGYCEQTGQVVCAENQAAAKCNAAPRLSLCPGESSCDTTCDGVDDDCDGNSDEDGSCDLKTCYRDFDGDMYYNPGLSAIASTCPSGYIDNCTGLGIDCDDSNDAIYPGAEETCNGKDDDCDSTIDDGFEAQFQTYYRDADLDSCGDQADTILACAAPPGYVDSTSGFDCNDGDATIHPGVADAVCNGIDNDCDGQTDEDYVPDTSCFLSDDCAQGNIASSCSEGVEISCQTGSLIPGCGDPACQAWLGDWIFTYSDLGNQQVTFTTAWEPGSPDGRQNPSFPCEVRGKRTSDNQSITILSSVYLAGYCAYYEAWDPSGSTPYDLFASPVAPYTSFTIIPDQSSITASPDKTIDYTLIEGSRMGCLDFDGDGYYGQSGSCDNGTDCNDADNLTYPGAPEICDQKDNDCDGAVDEGLEDCDNGTCKIVVYPKSIFKITTFISPIIPFVIIAEKDSGAEFKRPIEIDWGSVDMSAPINIRIGKRIIFGFILIRPLSLTKDVYPVTVTYGDGEEQGVCEGTITVK